jgi:hypothetical protein
VGILDSDDELGTCRTKADGSFDLIGHEWEVNGLEPYLIVKACRTDDPSICSVKDKVKFEYDIYGGSVMVAAGSNVYVDADFYQHICKGEVCQSA